MFKNECDKKVQDLYIKNYKTSMREIKEDLNKEVLAHGL